MAKRYTDNQKFFKPWLQELPTEYKLLWLFILDTCSIAGIWDVSFLIPEAIFKCKYDPSEAIKVLKKQITPLSERKWLVNDFISFQYKRLNPASPPHKAVINELEEAGIWNHEEETLNIPGSAEGTPRIPVKGTPRIDPSVAPSNVKLTEAEYKKLVASYGKQKAEECIAYLSSYKIEKDYKTKSDYLTILRWVSSAVDEKKTGKGRGAKPMKPGALNKGQSTDDVLNQWHGEEGQQ